MTICSVYASLWPPRRKIGHIARPRVADITINIYSYTYRQNVSIMLKVAHCSFQGGLYSCEMTYIPGADTMISWRFGGEMEDIWGSWSKDNVRLKRCEHVYSQLTSALGHCGPQRKNDLYSRRPHYVFLKVWGRNGRYMGVLVKRQCSFEECEQYFTVRYIVI